MQGLLVGNIIVILMKLCAFVGLNCNNSRRNTKYVSGFGNNLMMMIMGTPTGLEKVLGCWHTKPVEPIRVHSSVTN